MERLRVSINVGHSEGDFRALCEKIKMYFWIGMVLFII
jgi:hypothetical protein